MPRILQVLSSLDGGGIERMLHNYCSRIHNISFDFLIADPKIGILEEPMRELGFGIYRVPPLHNSIYKNIRTAGRIIGEGGYDIIHVHNSFKSFIPLALAKRAGVRVRIAHSHMTDMPEATAARLFCRSCTALTKHYATHLFACGRDAGRLWGDKAFDEGAVRIIPNAIDTKQFAFSESARAEKRRELGLAGKFVVGNVARLDVQKNQAFLLRAFAEIRKRRTDAVLLMAGRGAWEKPLKRQAAELGIGADVYFLGVSSEVPQLLSAMDVFLLPSLHEGFPVSLLEAQANGLPCLASRGNVTDEVGVTDLLDFLPLTAGPVVWAKATIRREHSRRKEGAELAVAAAGYDIDSEAEKLGTLYHNLLARQPKAGERLSGRR